MVNRGDSGGRLPPALPLQKTSLLCRPRKLSQVIDLIYISENVRVPRNARKKSGNVIVENPMNSLVSRLFFWTFSGNGVTSLERHFSLPLESGVTC